MTRRGLSTLVLAVVLIGQVAPSQARSAKALCHIACPKTGAPARCQDRPLLVRLCHGVADSIAAGDKKTWMQVISPAVVFRATGSPAAGKGSADLRVALQRAGGPRQLLGLAPRGPLTVRLVDDCSQCRRSLVTLLLTTGLRHARLVLEGARVIQAWSGSTDSARWKPPSFLTADTSIPCHPPFVRGLRFTGSTPMEHQRLSSAIWLDEQPRRPATTETDPMAELARCIAVGPHRGMNLRNWCCR